MGLGLAFRCFFRALASAEFRKRVEPLLDPPAAAAPAAPKGPDPYSAGSLRLLAILQRDGRLLDFLSEDISGYSDDQIGAAVRDVHRDCRAALEKYVHLAPLLEVEEGGRYQVVAGFDAARIRLTGNVKGSPPHTGTVAHRGWLATSVALPPINPDPTILAPAEVEIP